MPKTQLERDILRKKKTVNELQLMREIELLKEQVKELQEQVFNGTAVVKSVHSNENKLGNDAQERTKSAELKGSEQLKDAESDKV